MLKDKKTNISRRQRLDWNWPAELAISNAMQEVEKVGADVRLTEAIDLLGKAKDLVADFADEIFLKNAEYIKSELCDLADPKERDFFIRLANTCTR